MPGVCVSEDDAWLLGLIAGDGHVREAGLVIAIGGESDMDMAEEAAAILDSRWPCTSVKVHTSPRKPPRVAWLGVFAYGRELADAIRAYGRFGVHRWRIPSAILGATLQVQAAWVAGFTDAEGCVQHRPERGSRSVQIDSVNERGLRQVAKILKALGVKTRHTVHDRGIPDRKPGHKLHVCNRAAIERFAEVIPLRCPRKIATLREALASYQREILLEDDVDRMVPQIAKRLATREPYTKIAKALGITPEQVRSVVRTRGLKGPGRGHGARHHEVEALVAKAMTRIEAGEIANDVANDLGVTKAALSMAMRKRGLSVGARRGANTVRSAELAALVPQARKLVAAGKTNREIADALGHDLTPTRVAQLLFKHGIKR